MSSESMPLLQLPIHSIAEVSGCYIADLEQMSSDHTDQG